VLGILVRQEGEAPGRDVFEGLVWIPFVTFWQVTADLPVAVDVPATAPTSSPICER
jgi:uncharacterized membrane protein